MRPAPAHFATVTLSVRVWIEMGTILCVDIVLYVTLSVRVWIEICMFTVRADIGRRHPQCEGVD